MIHLRDKDPALQRGGNIGPTFHRSAPRGGHRRRRRNEAGQTLLLPDSEEESTKARCFDRRLPFCGRVRTLTRAEGRWRKFRSGRSNVNDVDVDNDDDDSNAGTPSPTPRRPSPSPCCGGGNSSSNRRRRSRTRAQRGRRARSFGGGRNGREPLPPDRSGRAAGRAVHASRCAPRTRRKRQIHAPARGAVRLSARRSRTLRSSVRTVPGGSGPSTTSDTCHGTGQCARGRNRSTVQLLSSGSFPEAVRVPIRAGDPPLRRAAATLAEAT
jgi:hypothetical protein